MVSAPDNELRLRLRVALKVMVALALAGAAVVGWRFLTGGATDGPSATARYAVGDLGPGQARTVDWDGRPVIVLRRHAATVTALHREGAAGPRPEWFVALASGTARGCPVLWEAARHRFRESCGDARYDAAGRPLGASAPEPLRVPPHHWQDGQTLVIGRDRP